MSAKTLYFCAVGKGDTPIYESHLTSGGAARLQKDDLIQFIVHAALDATELKAWTTTQMHLRDVDRFNDLTISAFVTAGHTRFLLLHDTRGTDDSAVKHFFSECYELYVKVACNPFYDKHTPITNKTFDERVKQKAAQIFKL